MHKSKIIKNLIIINLVFLAILLFSKMFFIHSFVRVIFKSFLTPLVFSVFLFYIIKPLNNIFIKKGLKPSISALLTLTLGLFVASGTITLFSGYIVTQLAGIIKEITNIMENHDSINGIISIVNSYIPIEEIYKSFANITNTYTQNLVHNLFLMVNFIIHSFSTLFLVLVILFYLLKDGCKFKDKVMQIVPEKYKEFLSKTLSESDLVLGAYVTGQAKVALALSIMIFTGYKIIGIPNALLFASTTFILAFIPFVGFLISMVIPSIIALSLGFFMLGKLAIVFIIVQTLKGRVVVPAIMSHAMKIHPLTDIILVIGAISIGGPLAAFLIVPIYAIFKTILTNLNLLKK